MCALCLPMAARRAAEMYSTAVGTHMIARCASHNCQPQLWHHCNTCRAGRRFKAHVYLRLRMPLLMRVQPLLAPPHVRSSNGQHSSTNAAATSCTIPDHEAAHAPHRFTSAAGTSKLKVEVRLTFPLTWPQRYTHSAPRTGSKMLEALGK